MTMNWEKYERELNFLNLTSEDREFLKKVFNFAAQIHAGEKRLSGEDYLTHSAAVSLNLVELKMDRATIAAGLLHDVAETTPTALAEIRKNFGEEIAFLVDAVTKVEKVKASGTDRALESVRKMFMAVAEDIRVVIIKLADRLHNMETADWLSREKRERIAGETLSLYAPLAERLGMWNVKAQLEDLSMKYLYPQEYERIASEVKKIAPERERYLKKIAPQVEAELLKENIRPLELSYRAKHLYSIWQKLKRYDDDWTHLADLIALRIIVPDIKDCYAAVGIIHKLWKPVPGKFKDYIALPKPNGYQSLHTSVFTKTRTMVEFQIRTPQMHREAEAGIAAHWAWSEAGKPKEGLKILGQKFNWIRQLHDWHKEFKKERSSSEELLEAFKIDFFKDRIFVLTPKGDVIDLPKGATPLDFAYHIHSEIGNHASGAKVDGRLVAFERELQSGEVVEIITQKNKRPSREWLSLVKTNLAKNRIRKTLRISPKRTFLEPEEKLVEVKIYGKNRVGFIKDITSIFAKSRINIQTLISARSGNEEAPIRVRFIPKNKAEIEKVKPKLEKIAGVKKVTTEVRS